MPKESCNKPVIFSVRTRIISCEIINEIDDAKKLIEILENTTDFRVCYATGSLRSAAEYKLKSIGINFDKKQLVASDNI